MNGYVKPEMLLLLVIVIPGIIGGILAANRARSVFLWGVLSAIFPVFLLVIYYHKPLREVQGKFRQCPACKEFQGWNNIVCKYCNADLREGREEP